MPLTTNETAGFPEWTDPDDAPVLTEADVRDVEVFKGNSFVRRGRGRPKTGAAKELVSIRLNPDVLARLRATGPGWQSRVDALLAQAIVDHPNLVIAAPAARSAAADGGGTLVHRYVSGANVDRTIDSGETAEEAVIAKPVRF